MAARGGRVLSFRVWPLVCDTLQQMAPHPWKYKWAAQNGLGELFGGGGTCGVGGEYALYLMTYLLVIRKVKNN